MRFSEAWLRAYVNPPLDTAQLVHQLTMAGLEVDSAEPAAGTFSGVVVAEILETSPHPQADRLKVCIVAAGLPEPLQIVCGAPNARAGLRAPLAMEGAELPGGLKIKRSALRGVESCGMMCSAKELGIDENAAGLLELPADAPVGTSLREYLQLDDTLIEVDLTPNRADCLSVEGIAREVALLNGLDLTPPETAPVPVTIGDTLPVSLPAPEACPRYLGRMIKGVSRSAETPLWMKERLRRSGLRSLDAVVDVTNYILLELGQPLHAFDAAKLEGGIQARYAQPGEKLSLLNGQTVELHADTLVIADDRKALALAGIMGGSESAVGETTVDIFLECAFFSPALIMGKARRYGLATDSSHRFERGVDFEMQARAIERATRLILDIAGGEAGPVVEASGSEHLPKREPIALRSARISRLLGLTIEPPRVKDILSRLGLNPQDTAEGWSVTPPGFRFDIAIEADLIEELGRVYGYDALPRRQPVIPAAMRPVSEHSLALDRVKDVLVDRGFQEAITYSFVDDALQKFVEPELPGLPLKNPISAELGVMRTGLWVGLLDAALKNANRQQTRVRLFETGLRFIQRPEGLDQRKSIAALVMGTVNAEQWGEKTQPVDFYDLKADVEALVRLTGRSEALSFAAGSHPALHPGQTAEIKLDGECLGWIGMLHPRLEKQLGFEQNVFLFQLDQDILLQRTVPKFKPLSRFPQTRRDIALIVEAGLPVDRLVDCAQTHGGDLLREVSVFDVYRGQGVEPGKKSVALALIWRDDAETLTDAKVDAAVATVVEALAIAHEAKLRD
ncbi:phenylalanyl-tRNA synthetase beta subunit [Methylomagnum ishizawai]|uniref:Phenylalanine--tRNA ligase beta subunit n=1 Tax=Methylomagnum ishizawai TaxID=1760988 RepID=A0A1Y6CYI6_9GAMM|nr:phenylalanine--tRNA ligase subunit beta [Methylomagnum ishizawai]SMF95356.1 phenylalanyl-tRNA synthetase beta subunit [Methylomagnum ishizawai]